MVTHDVTAMTLHEVVRRTDTELLRALPLFSDKLGLSGKADLVEVRRDPADSTRIAEARPVEYKKGPARRWSNDHAQLCAQALCLEEMFGLRIPSGLIFHAASALRTSVEFDAALRALTLEALAGLRTTLAQRATPPAVLKPQCDGCSLRGVCLPEASTWRRSHLFEPRHYA